MVMNDMKRLPFTVLAGIFFLSMTFLPPPGSFAANLYSFRDERGAIHFTNVPGLGSAKFFRPATKLQTNKNLFITQEEENASISDRDYTEVIMSACEQFDVDLHMIRAVIKAESNFNPGAVSPKGAMGLMQLMPDTARQMGLSDPFDPIENIQAAGGYLSQLLNSLNGLNGDLPVALAA